MEVDDLDIYNDLDDFHEEHKKKTNELLAFENVHNELRKDFDKLKLENKALNKKIIKMEINFQSLLNTAKAEIKRKDAQIAELRKEKDDICFRRRTPFRKGFEGKEQQTAAIGNAFQTAVETDSAHQTIERFTKNPFKVSNDERITAKELQVAPTASLIKPQSSETTPANAHKSEREDLPERLRNERGHKSETIPANENKSEREDLPERSRYESERKCSRDNEQQKRTNSTAERGYQSKAFKRRRHSHENKTKSTDTGESEKEDYHSRDYKKDKYRLKDNICNKSSRKYSRDNHGTKKDSLKVATYEHEHTKRCDRTAESSNKHQKNEVAAAEKKYNSIHRKEYEHKKATEADNKKKQLLKDKEKEQRYANDKSTKYKQSLLGSSAKKIEKTALNRDKERLGYAKKYVERAKDAQKVGMPQQSKTINDKETCLNDLEEISDMEDDIMAEQTPIISTIHKKPIDEIEKSSQTKEYNDAAKNKVSDDLVHKSEQAGKNLLSDDIDIVLITKIQVNDDIVQKEALVAKNDLNESKKQHNNNEIATLQATCTAVDNIEPSLTQIHKSETNNIDENSNLNTQPNKILIYNANLKCYSSSLNSELLENVNDTSSNTTTTDAAVVSVTNTKYSDNNTDEKCLAIYDIADSSPVSDTEQDVGTKSTNFVGVIANSLIEDLFEQPATDEVIELTDDTDGDITDTEDSCSVRLGTICDNKTDAGEIETTQPKHKKVHIEIIENIKLNTLFELRDYQKQQNEHKIDESQTTSQTLNEAQDVCEILEACVEPNDEENVEKVDKIKHVKVQHEIADTNRVYNNDEIVDVHEKEQENVEQNLSGDMAVENVVDDNDEEDIGNQILNEIHDNEVENVVNDQNKMEKRDNDEENIVNQQGLMDIHNNANENFQQEQSNIEIHDKEDENIVNEESTIEINDNEAENIVNEESTIEINDNEAENIMNVESTIEINDNDDEIIVNEQIFREIRNNKAKNIVNQESPTEIHDNAAENIGVNGPTEIPTLTLTHTEAKELCQKPARARELVESESQQEDVKGISHQNILSKSAERAPTQSNDVTETIAITDDYHIDAVSYTDLFEDHEIGVEEKLLPPTDIDNLLHTKSLETPHKMLIENADNEEISHLSTPTSKANETNQITKVRNVKLEEQQKMIGESFKHLDIKEDVLKAIMSNVMELLEFNEMPARKLDLNASENGSGDNDDKEKIDETANLVNDNCNENDDDNEKDHTDKVKELVNNTFKSNKAQRDIPALNVCTISNNIDEIEREEIEEIESKSRNTTNLTQNQADIMYKNQREIVKETTAQLTPMEEEEKEIVYRSKVLENIEEIRETNVEDTNLTKNTEIIEIGKKVLLVDAALHDAALDILQVKMTTTNDDDDENNADLETKAAYETKTKAESAQSRAISLIPASCNDKLTIRINDDENDEDDAGLPTKDAYSTCTKTEELLTTTANGPLTDIVDTVNGLQSIAKSTAESQCRPQVSPDSEETVRSIETAKNISAKTKCYIKMDYPKRKSAEKLATQKSVPHNETYSKNTKQNDKKSAKTANAVPNTKELKPKMVQRQPVALPKIPKPITKIAGNKVSQQHKISIKTENEIVTNETKKKSKLIESIEAKGAATKKHSFVQAKEKPNEKLCTSKSREVFSNERFIKKTSSEPKTKLQTSVSTTKTKVQLGDKVAIKATPKQLQSTKMNRNNSGENTNFSTIVTAKSAPQILPHQILPLPKLGAYKIPMKRSLPPTNPNQITVATKTSSLSKLLPVTKKVQMPPKHQNILNTCEVNENEDASMIYRANKRKRQIIEYSDEDEQIPVVSPSSATFDEQNIIKKPKLQQRTSTKTPPISPSAVSIFQTSNTSTEGFLPHCSPATINRDAKFKELDLRLESLFQSPPRLNDTTNNADAGDCNISLLFADIAPILGIDDACVGDTSKYNALFDGGQVANSTILDVNNATTPNLTTAHVSTVSGGDIASHSNATSAPNKPNSCSITNLDINETNDDNASCSTATTVNDSFVTELSSMQEPNDSGSIDKSGCATKRLSLGNNDYLVEKVSDDVVNVFITRKRTRKRPN